MGKRHEVWAADCETDPFQSDRVPEPFIWGCTNVYTREYQSFGSAELLLLFLCERRCTVYFHNGGKFDGHYLREWFDSDQEIRIINGRIASFRIGKAEFRDSYNLIPVPLARYQKEKFDYDILEASPLCVVDTREETRVRDLPENRIAIERYLKSDCDNLASILLAYFTRYGRGFTQAGAAMNYWVKNYNKGIKPKQSAAQFERYRPFYNGGRVECFASGYQETSFKVVDKNSAYPEAMCHDHPISPEAIALSKLPTKERELTRCMVSLRGVSRGAFAHRIETGELTFPRDDKPRVYDVTGWELLTAMELDAVQIHDVLGVHYFREVVNFSDYIHHFYLERKAAKVNGDRAGDIFAKLFMNSCYGKFASNPENYHEYMLASPEKMAQHAKMGFLDYHDWGDGRRLMWRQLPLDRHYYYNVATAASITGYVRARMFKDLCGVRSPFYCDTDSIAALNVEGLNLGKELGQWKVELVCDAYAIVGKKMYAFRSAFDQGWIEDEKRFEYPKGAWKSAHKGVDVTAAEIVCLAKGEGLPRGNDGRPYLEYRPKVPTYSITRPKPRFINRKVRVTANIQLGSLLGIQ